MAKLILTLDGAFLGEHDIDKDTLTIGRRPSNDVHIDNLAISGSHAVVRTLGNDFFLEDLDSTNGTIVNGRSIKKHLLQHGDLIELGKYHLKFANEAVVHAAPGTQDDFEKTMIIRPIAAQAAEPQPEASPPQPEPPHNPNPVGHIQVLTGVSAGHELVLNKALTTLGKAGVQVAVISRRPQGFFITHVEGASQPVVNGVPIGLQAHALNEHDIIELAGVKMEFFLSGNQH